MYRSGSLPLKKAAFRSASGSGTCRRCLHASSVKAQVSKFAMPAMSPTMSEGGIAQWKVKEGQSFSAGDVLLEVETDKATIDVEAQDDGVIGKIIVPDGAKSIAVGHIIALLAEEGDDISNLEIPKEGSTNPSPPREESANTKAAEPQHQQASSSLPSVEQDVHVSSSRPLFPSVLRLLSENGIENADKVKGTGLRGMLTKGDVLAYLGKIPSPAGSYKTPKSIFPDATALKEEQKPSKPLDGTAIRQAIVSSFLQASARSRTVPAPVVPYDFDSILADYLPSGQPQQIPVSALPSSPAKASGNFLDGLI